jgi:Xaa-Pro aminopeptidase
VSTEPWTRPWPEFIGKTLGEIGARRVAFEDRALTVADHTDIAGSAPGIDLLPAGGAFHALRAAKDAQELDAIRRAARVTDAAFTAVTTALQPGITERQLAWRLEVAMRDHGADRAAFPTIVAAGPHGARPHHEPSDRPITAGEPVVIDMGALVDGYCADLTRTICVGEMSSLFLDRYNSVLRAQRAALAGVRAGMNGREADAVAREPLAAAGLGDSFVHGLGHGVGLLVHEFPSLGAKSDDVLEPGFVVTIEPGVYFDGWGGIRIEDLCVVTNNGLEVLSAAEK